MSETVTQRAEAWRTTPRCRKRDEPETLWNGSGMGRQEPEGDTPEWSDTAERDSV